MSDEQEPNQPDRWRDLALQLGLEPDRPSAPPAAPERAEVSRSERVAEPEPEPVASLPPVEETPPPSHRRRRLEPAAEEDFSPRDDSPWIEEEAEDLSDTTAEAEPEEEPDQEPKEKSAPSKRRRGRRSSKASKKAATATDSEAPADTAEQQPTQTTDHTSAH